MKENEAAYVTAKFCYVCCWIKIWIKREPTHLSDRSHLFIWILMKIFWKVVGYMCMALVLKQKGRHHCGLDTCIPLPQNRHDRVQNNSQPSMVASLNVKRILIVSLTWKGVVHCVFSLRDRTINKGFYFNNKKRF